MATLAELTTPLTKDEIEAAIYAAITARGVPVTSWKSGATARVIISGVSIILSAFSALQQRLAESGFLEKSSGDWLTLVAKFVYGVEKSNGTFASGNVTFNNPGTGVFAPAIGDIIASNSTTGKTYRNTAAFTLAAAQTGVVVPFQAIELGSDSTSPALAIDTLVTVMTGVAIGNAEALVGADADTDPGLIEKCLAKTGTLSPNGPKDAYRFVTFEATKDDGSTTGITRLTATPDGLGGISVYVASATGPVTGTIGDTATDLGATDEAIQTQVTPLAVTVAVSSAVALSVSVSYEIWVRSTIGVPASELANSISTALATFMSIQAIGGSKKVAGSGSVFRQAIEAVITETVGTENLIDLNMTAPAVDIPVAANEAPVLPAAAVTSVINYVSL